MTTTCICFISVRKKILTLGFLPQLFVDAIERSFINVTKKRPTMVCEKCEKKLGKVITPDPWKSGARNTVESGGRKVGENKALSASKNRFNPYTAKFEICRICRQKVHQVGSHYCQACAYKKAICAMCGKKLMSTKNYKQSAT